MPLAPACSLEARMRGVRGFGIRLTMFHHLIVAGGPVSSWTEETSIRLYTGFVVGLR